MSKLKQNNLTQSERNALITTYDDEYMRKMVRHFITKIPSGIEMDDLVSEGFVAVCEAAKYYDEDKANFETYAYSRIRRGLQTFISHNTTPIKKPSSVYEAERYINKFTDEFVASNGRRPTSTEIYEGTKDKSSQIKNALKFPKVGSDTIDDGDNSVSAVDNVEGDQPLTEERLMFLSEHKAFLKKLQAVLSPQQFRVITLMFPADGVEKSADRIADDLEVPVSRISEIKSKAFAEIRKHNELADMLKELVVLRAAV